LRHRTMDWNERDELIGKIQNLRKDGYGYVAIGRILDISSRKALYLSRIGDFPKEVRRKSRILELARMKAVSPDGRNVKKALGDWETLKFRLVGEVTR